MTARLAASTQQPPRQALAEFEAAARASFQGMGRLVRTGAQPTDYAGGAREAFWRHTTAAPSPAARPVATSVTTARELWTLIRAPASRTDRSCTPAPHEAPERPAWPGMAGRPRPGEPGWPEPPPNYVPRPMSEQELARRTAGGIDGIHASDRRHDARAAGKFSDYRFTSGDGQRDTANSADTLPLTRFSRP